MSLMNESSNGGGSSEAAANNLNSIMNLFNKENLMGNQSNNDLDTELYLSQSIYNNNILNMAKAAAQGSYDMASNNGGLMNSASVHEQIVSKERIEGVVAVVATKRPSSNVSFLCCAFIRKRRFALWGTNSSAAS